jgi:ergothioneine biosynthesis protein EgtB
MATRADQQRARGVAADPARLAEAFRAVRDLTRALAAPLSDADASAQSMADASPAKWHLAHTTWFFETFLLRDHVPGYRLYDDRYPYLFNSYYEAEGERHERAARGLLTRPALADILAWRDHVDAAMADAMARLVESAGDLVTLGLHHEQQHQELLLTDILHLFAQNPLGPAMFDTPRMRRDAHPSPYATPKLGWVEGATGRVAIGHDPADGFAFDCEGPRHDVLLTPHALADRLVTNGEWIDFIADGGYADPAHWLADGWAWVNDGGIAAPLYWRQGEGGGWQQFTHSGWQAVDPVAPVTHISLYESDAYASWAGARLPTEAEWESAAAALSPTSGNQLDSAGPVAPQPAPDGDLPHLRQMFGDCWEWTGSAYRPYPGFRACEGAVGEYNGKFMSGQFVLRGGSCATPRGHVRASYRNFFYPHQRWQFTGLRLAKDL